MGVLAAQRSHPPYSRKRHRMVERAERGYQPIENYGVIGDLYPVALVGTDGSIDFLAFPRVDSPTVFAVLLEQHKGGRLQIAPRLGDARQKQLYLPDANILLRRFLSTDGAPEISDFMPVEAVEQAHSLVRRAKTVRGEIYFRMHCICKVRPLWMRRVCLCRCCGLLARVTRAGSPHCGPLRRRWSMTRWSIARRLATPSVMAFQARRARFPCARSCTRSAWGVLVIWSKRLSFSRKPSVMSITSASTPSTLGHAVNIWGTFHRRSPISRSSAQPMTSISGCHPQDSRPET